MIEKFSMGGGLNKPEKSCAIADNPTGELFLKMLWIRDQAHVFHWQTKFNAEHMTLGAFYEEYLSELDELAEVIFGKTGKTFTIGDGSINLSDYSDKNLSMYLEKTSKVFMKDFPKIFPNNNENIDIYHIVGDILEVINKMRYLMSQK